MWLWSEITSQLQGRQAVKKFFSSFGNRTLIISSALSIGPNLLITTFRPHTEEKNFMCAKSFASILWVVTIIMRRSLLTTVVSGWGEISSRKKFKRGKRRSHINGEQPVECEKVKLIRAERFGSSRKGQKKTKTWQEMLLGPGESFRIVAGLCCRRRELEKKLQGGEALLKLFL